MANSLLEQLPSFVAAGTRQAAQILEQMEVLDYARLRRSSSARQENPL